MLDTKSSVGNRDTYTEPAAFGFQINPPRLQSDFTKFGGTLGILRVQVDFVFRQFADEAIMTRSLTFIGDDKSVDDEEVDPPELKRRLEEAQKVITLL